MELCIRQGIKSTTQWPMAKKDLGRIGLRIYIFVGSRSLIIQLMKPNLIDEFQLCIHPVVAGKGLPLFENLNNRTIFKLVKTKTFNGGAVILYYEPRKE